MPVSYSGYIICDVEAIGKVVVVIIVAAAQWRAEGSATAPGIQPGAIQRGSF